ncbi:MAG: P-loop NTPase [Desulfovibrionaceae bacterium]|nr:P-loop NTPase [Desulfovibrionaceae bacterium]MBF0514856.1 P-loop NTPase [Desulfovibrionaceae bacterium]
MARVPKILGVIGPKGGVGKTTISANLAIALTRAGANVVAMDLDLGSANLHVVFGLRNVRHTLDDFLVNKVASLDAVVMDTAVPGLKLIAGGNVPGIASLPYQRKVKLLRHLRKLDCDYLLLDLAAGVTNNVVDFALIAQKSLLVTTPDVPSLMSLYSFLKTSVYRRLQLLFRSSGDARLLALLENAGDAEAHPELKTMADFFTQAALIDPELAERGAKVLARFDPLILVNRVKTASDMKAGRAISNLMDQFLGLHRGEILSIREDAAVGAAAARMQPALLSAPDCGFALDMRKLAGALGAASE